MNFFSLHNAVWQLQWHYKPHSILSSSLITGLYSWERRGVITKSLLLKKALKETCFLASWIKGNQLSSGIEKIKTVHFLLTHQPCVINGSCHWCWNVIVELQDLSILVGLWACPAECVYFWVFEANVGEEILDQKLKMAAVLSICTRKTHANIWLFP